MKICDFTQPELKCFLAECNFTDDETDAFLILAAGSSTEEMAELTNVSVSTAKRIKKKIWSKIDRIMSLG